MSATLADEPTVSAPENWGPAALDQVREARRRHQSTIAAHRYEWIRSNGYFYDHLTSAIQFVVEPNKRVLEVRCETGELLASAAPTYGDGVEISDAMSEAARLRHPDLHFVTSDIESLDLGETFDYILINH